MESIGQDVTVLADRATPSYQPETAAERTRNWIRDHQLLSFFLITFSISWSLGLLYVLSDSDLFALLMAVALCGPAFAAIAISAVIDTDPRRGPRRHFWLTFLTAWLLSAAVAFVANVQLFETEASLPVLALVSLVIAVPVASVISATRSRRLGVRRLMGSLTSLRGVWPWALLALVFIPALLLLAQPVDRMLGEPVSGPDLPAAGWALVGLVFLRLCYQLVFFNATGEEVGWRGFALPRLQARTSPLMAALVIGAFWAPWHLFVWQSEGSPVGTLAFWVEMFSAHFLFSVLLVWIYNRAGGSILVAGVGHAAANTAFRFLPLLSALAIQLTWLGAALVLVFLDRMWRRLPEDHPAVYRQTKHAEWATGHDLVGVGVAR